jgi:RNA polymerase sigma factor (sigma-70 family)
MDEPMPHMAAQQQTIINSIANYGKQLFAFIRSKVSTDEDAEDILQDVWYQFSSQPEIEAISSISGWLYRVARNRIIDRSRKKKNELLDETGFVSEDGEWIMPEFLLADNNNPETEHIKQIFWEELFAALEELPQSQRSVFERNEFEDMTLQQIADADAVPLKTAISRKRYAVLHLRNRLEEQYNDLINN